MPDSVGNILERFRIEMGLFLIGVICLLGGIFWQRISGAIPQGEFEVIAADIPMDGVATSGGGLIIDISGGVTSPGVYTLPAGSRIEDAITRAGGISEKADVQAVALAVNRAERLKDGQKIFIPLQGQKDELGVVAGGHAQTININTASQSELEELKGVGAVTAQKIISQRPYADISELVEKKIVSQKTFETIKTQLSVW